MEKNVFSDLENLGIDGADSIDIFKKSEENLKETEETKKAEISNEAKQKINLYDKEIKCPVCEQTFTARMVKTSATKILRKDSDFFINYDVVNPYFYDVWVCKFCGYASMKADFPKIRQHQKDLIASKISTKWQGKNYPEIYDVNIAIERYKLALYNSVIMESNTSRKAMNCLKIAWMYRIAEDKENELYFLKQALEGFNVSFTNESTPIYGMDHGTLMYLIGELYRRIGDFENANIWFSKLITAGDVEQKIKDMGRDQRDLIKEEEKRAKAEEALNNSEYEEEDKSAKKGLFSKLFKK